MDGVWEHIQIYNHCSDVRGCFTANCPGPAPRFQQRLLCGAGPAPKHKQHKRPPALFKDSEHGGSARLLSLATAPSELSCGEIRVLTVAGFPGWGGPGRR